MKLQASQGREAALPWPLADRGSHGDEREPVVLGEVAEVLDVQRRQRQLVGQAAGGNPGVVLQPGPAPPLGRRGDLPQIAAMSSLLCSTGIRLSQRAIRSRRSVLAWLAPECGDGSRVPSTWPHDGVVRPWKRRLSDDERSVLLSELLLRHPELVAEAEEITSTLLVVENDQELADEITARLRALRPSGPVSVDAGRARALDVLQPYIDDLTWRKERGARRAAADIAIAILLGLH
jgi:hypothetical protein